MRRGSLLGSIAIASVIASGAFGGAAPAHAVAVVIRYASPSGTASADCLEAAPCDIVTAINDASAGDRVEIEAGRYGSAAAPITTRLSDYGIGELDIFGAPGPTLPVIYSSASYGIFLFFGSEISRIDLQTSGTAAGLVDIGGDIDHVIVESSAAAYGACGIYGATLSDSLCTTSGASDPAIALETNTASSADLLGVTAEATNTGGVGLLVEEDGADTLDMTVTNSILHGVGADVGTVAAAGGTVSVDLSHSDFRPGKTSTSGAGSSAISGDSTDIAAAPKFLHPATGDYQEKLGSPTINAGASDPVDTDLAGNPRTLGSAPDMGAYEFLEKPTAHTLTLGSKTAHKVRMTVKVNPEGLTTEVKLVAIGGGKHVTSHEVLADNGRTTKTITLRLHGLKRHTRYKVHAVATNQAGHTDSATKSLTTRSG